MDGARMRSLIGSLLRRGMRLGFDRGVLDGEPVWLVLGGLALLGHLAGRAMRREEEVVIHADLTSADRFQIRQVPR